MAYHVYISCDVCGRREGWKDLTVSKTCATALAREDGWSIGKPGWTCPGCIAKKKKKEGTESCKTPK